ncbi:MAG: hypothetical protein QOE92_116, partial [Chloroflexota bacterium]|nr:hypothetical protein [Chloroflexota bacterium]
DQHLDGVELVAFLGGVAAGASPSASLGAAEAAGIELARALRAVKTELQEIEG